MGTFIAAYTIVWLAFVFYIVRLKDIQRRLEQMVQAIESRRQESESQGETCSPTEQGA